MSKTLEAQTANGQARCQNATASGRQCLLAVHTDDTKHKYVNRNKEHVSLSSVLPAGFNLQAVTPTDVLKKEVGAHKDTKPRDADQKKVDKDAKANYIKNHAANNTTDTDFEKLVHTEYIVPPRAVDAVLDYLRRAANSGGTVAGTQLRYRRGTHASGNTRVQWAFLDKAKKRATPVTPSE